MSKSATDQINFVTGPKPPFDDKPHERRDAFLAWFAYGCKLHTKNRLPMTDEQTEYTALKKTYIDLERSCGDTYSESQNISDGTSVTFYGRSLAFAVNHMLLSDFMIETEILDPTTKVYKKTHVAVNPFEDLRGIARFISTTRMQADNAVENSQYFIVRFDGSGLVPTIGGQQGPLMRKLGKDPIQK